MVERIEKIVNGTVEKEASRYGREQRYRCYAPGTTTNPQMFDTLDQVADYLIANPRSLVRMEQNYAMTADHIHIDGIAREELAPPPAEQPPE